MGTTGWIFTRGLGRIFVVLALLGLVPAAWAQGTLLYDQTFTGLDLLSAPGVSFPTRSPVANGTSIDFGPGVEEHEVLMRLPIAVANSIPPGSSATLAIELDNTPVTVDNDFGVMAGDGDIFGGALLGDNNGGVVNAITYFDTGPVATVNIFDLILQGTGAPPDSITHICMETGSSTVFAARGPESGSGGITPALDATQALGFSFIGNDIDEEYRVNSVRIRLIEGVPNGEVACDTIDPDAAIPPGGVPAVTHGGAIGLVLALIITGAVLLRRRQPSRA
jgi:hypothetical protein